MKRRKSTFQSQMDYVPRGSKIRNRRHVSRTMMIGVFVFCSLSCPSLAFQSDVNLKRMDNISTRKGHRMTPVTLRMKTDGDSTLSIELPNNGTPRFSSRSTSAGAFVAFLIIAGLAIKARSPEELASGSFTTTVGNVLDATLPSSSTDLLAGVLGESIGGIFGAIATVILGSIFNLFRNATMPVDRSKAVNEAIASSDYFIANSASRPLLEAVGLPPALASISSVVFAAIPYQLVKLGQGEKERKELENMLLMQLLEEEEVRKRQRKFQFKAPFFLRKSQASNNAASIQKDLRPVVPDRKIDFVELFSDVTRWLEYDVLKTEIKLIAVDGLPLEAGVSGALFGILAAVSSQFYADILYGKFQYGPIEKQEAVFSRSVLDWVKVYASRAASSAALFGIYEESQSPIGRWIQGTLAGGVDGCIGSKEFDICLQTYIDTNAPGPSSEAQVRALVTNLVMVGQRLQDIAGDTTMDDIRSLLGAWAVSASSYIQDYVIM